MGLPDWCPCIDCAVSTTSSSTIAISDNEPDEVTQLKNTETVYSEPLTCRPLSLNRCRKHVPPEECSESSAVVTSSKKPQKSIAALLEDFNIGEDDLETFKKRECSANTTNNTEWAMKNFESWRIAHNAKFEDLQCPECWFKGKENLCG